MSIQSVSVFVWRRKAYVPTYGQVVNGGMLVAMEPVYTVDLDRDQIVEAVKTALAFGHPPIPDRSRDEWDKLMSTSPILSATGARSWSEFYRKAMQYTIEWGPAGTFLEFGYRAPEGGWLFDPGKRREFPLDASVEQVVDVILEDLSSKGTSRTSRH
jgi:hypothetical protein